MKMLPAGLDNAFNSNRVRITHDNVAAIIEAIIDGDFKIESSSRVYGNDMCYWVTCRAGGYRLWFYYNKLVESIGNCFACLTPKGREYLLNSEGGNVIKEFGTDRWRKLNDMLEEYREEDSTPERKIAVKEVYIVVIDADTDHCNKLGAMYDKGPGNRRGFTFPYELTGSGIFHEKSEAEHVAAKAREYFEDLKGKKTGNPMGIKRKKSVD